MRTILNLIWLLFGGFWLAVGYFFAGILALSASAVLGDVIDADYKMDDDKKK